MVDDPADGPVTVEAWRHVWRVGVAPQLSGGGLRALRAALAEDDPRLIQGATTSPPPLECVRDWRPEAACPVSLCGWLGEGLGTIAAVSVYFATVCMACDDALGESAGCRWLLNYWDETPRDEARRELLAEVDAELARRAAAR